MIQIQCVSSSRLDVKREDLRPPEIKKKRIFQKHIPIISSILFESKGDLNCDSYRSFRIWISHWYALNMKIVYFFIQMINYTKRMNERKKGVWSWFAARITFYVWRDDCLCEFEPISRSFSFARTQLVLYGIKQRCVDSKRMKQNEKKKHRNTV